MQDLTDSVTIFTRYQTELAFFGVFEPYQLKEFVVTGKLAGHFEPITQTLSISESSMRQLLLPFLEDFEEEEPENE